MLPKTKESKNHQLKAQSLKQSLHSLSNLSSFTITSPWINTRLKCWFSQKLTPLTKRSHPRRTFRTRKASKLLLSTQWPLLAIQRSRHTSCQGLRSLRTALKVWMTVQPRPLREKRKLYNRSTAKTITQAKAFRTPLWQRFSNLKSKSQSKRNMAKTSRSLSCHLLWETKSWLEIRQLLWWQTPKQPLHRTGTRSQWLSQGTTSKRSRNSSMRSTRRKWSTGTTSSTCEKTSC